VAIPGTDDKGPAATGRVAPDTARGVVAYDADAVIAAATATTAAAPSAFSCARARRRAPTSRGVPPAAL